MSPAPAPIAADPAPDPAPKAWWQSRAIIGALVVVAAQGLRLTGWEIDTEALTDALLNALSLLGAALAWWGRVQATRPISRRVAPGLGSDQPLRRAGGLRPAAGAAAPGLPADPGRPGPLDAHSS
ncbi:MAG: hypothetical protein IPN92_07055 [Chromatiaceae bacterium]|nr:hypothetical protein [Chromatiaceae bacterium]